MELRGILKDNLRKGHGDPFSFPHKNVIIIDTEVNFIFGRRYKIIGSDLWFEANAFEYIEGENE